MAFDHNSQFDVSDEQELMGRLRARDQSALTSIYDGYSNVVYALAFRIIGRQAEAKEVVVDTFWEVWQQTGGKESAAGSLGAWIITVARRRALDRRRMMPAQLPTNSDAWTPIEAAPPLINGHHAERKPQLTEQSMRVRAALAGLSAAQREAIELAFYHGLSHPEIAARRGEPLGAVKTHIRLGLTILREQLDLASLEKDKETSLA